MNKLKKRIALLVILGLMPSPKAAAGDLSYGIKIAGANSFATLSDKDKEDSKQLEARPQKQGMKLKSENIIWNPWFGAALYIERAFNNHIGLGAELLYNRFDQTIKGSI